MEEAKALKIHDPHDCPKLQNEEKKVEDINNNESSSMEESYEAQAEQEEVEDTNIIPWRAHLRKTNSKLNLLD